MIILTSIHWTNFHKVIQNDDNNLTIVETIYLIKEFNTFTLYFFLTKQEKTDMIS